VVANHVRLFDETVKRFGQVDVAVNTVGVVIEKPTRNVTEVDYEVSFGANSKAAFFLVQEAGCTMADGGSTVTIVNSLLAAHTDS